MLGTTATAVRRGKAAERDDAAVHAIRADTSTNAKEVQKDRAHVFHSWSAQKRLHPLPIARAAGTYFWDFDGKKYIDFASQLVNLNLGHCHPKIIAAIEEQAHKLPTIAPGFANDARSEAARLIAEIAPGDLNRVFFTNGGAEANENAIRMARAHTRRFKVLSMYRSYHGATATAIAASGDPRRWGTEPMAAPGIVHFWGPYLYRSAFHSGTEQEECERALKHLRDTIMVEGYKSIAAILLETVVGTNGILVPPDGYLKGVRAICDEFGICLIADEVMAGFGRCGKWFAVDNWHVTPDLITFAKGVNSGYVPLGGVIISDKIASTFDDERYFGGLTYSGHPLACAAAVASINAFKDEHVLENVRVLAKDVLDPGLQSLADKHPSVGEVRGLGAFWAIEFVRNKKTREPLTEFNASGAAFEPMDRFAKACVKHGLWPFIHDNRIHVVPPLNATPEDVRYGLDIVDKVISETADTYCTGH